MSACPYWGTHDASPGEPVAFEETQAVRLYQEIQQVGWDMFLALRTIRLTEQQADALYVRLTYLAQVMPAIRQAG